MRASFKEYSLYFRIACMHDTEAYTLASLAPHPSIALSCKNSLPKSGIISLRSDTATKQPRKSSTPLL